MILACMVSTTSLGIGVTKGMGVTEGPRVTVRNVISVARRVGFDRGVMLGAMVSVGVTVIVAVGKLTTWPVLFRLQLANRKRTTNPAKYIGRDFKIFSLLNKKHGRTTEVFLRGAKRKAAVHSFAFFFFCAFFNKINHLGFHFTPLYPSIQPLSYRHLLPSYSDLEAGEFVLKLQSSNRKDRRALPAPLGKRKFDWSQAGV